MDKKEKEWVQRKVEDLRKTNTKLIVFAIIISGLFVISQILIIAHIANQRRHVKCHEEYEYFMVHLDETDFEKSYSSDKYEFKRCSPNIEMEYDYNGFKLIPKGKGKCLISRVSEVCE